MKHLFSFLFLCGLMLSANLSAQADLTFNFLTAFSLEHTDYLIQGENGIESKKGDFCFELSQRDKDGNETVVGQIFASTVNQTISRIAGAYRIGAIGTYSYLYPDGETKVRLASGALYIECVGDTTINDAEERDVILPLYRIRLFDCLSTDGTSYTFEGQRVPGFGIDKAYYDEYLADESKHTEDWFFFPLDKPLQAEEVSLLLYNLIDRTENDHLWLVQGLDFDAFPEGYEVVVVAAMNSMLGAAPQVLLKGNEGAPLTCIYYKNEPIEVVSGYGVSYLTAQQGRVWDFYLTDINDKIYHVVISAEDYYSYSTDAADNFERNYSAAYLEKSANAVSVSVFDRATAGEIVFYVSEFDDDIIIPEGTYTIGFDRAPGMVKASAGTDLYTSLLTPSYFCALDNQGYAAAASFLHSGTVTVSNNNGSLHIEVDALNSKNATIKVTIDTTVTAIGDVENDTPQVSKMLDDNGRIIILRGGVKYDLNGNVIP